MRQIMKLTPMCGKKRLIDQVVERGWLLYNFVDNNYRGLTPNQRRFW